MKSSTTGDFRKKLNQLPISIREQANKAYELWRDNSNHPSLLKRVSQRQPIYPARVSLNYRALGLLENGQIYWFWIGTHAEYDELLKRL